MRISEIIAEAPAQAVGQAVGKTAYNVGKAAGQGVAMLNKPTVPNPQAAADSAAVRKGISSGITKWATGKSELDPKAQSTAKNVGSDDVLLQSLIDKDAAVNKNSIQQFKQKIPLLRLPYTMDVNSINAALDQALTDKPLDQTQINTLKTLQQHLKKT